MGHTFAPQQSLVGTVDDYKIDVDGDSDFRFAWDEEELFQEAESLPVSLYEKFNTRVAYGLANANNSHQRGCRLAVRFR